MRMHCLKTTMTNETSQIFNPELDLKLERNTDIAPDKVWAAWTQPELLTQWFTPAPWLTVEAEIDLRPGGVFSSIMRSPEGQDYPNVGCVLEVVPGQRLVWTSMLGPGFRPSPAGAISADNLALTAIISIEPHNGGTKYTAIALHSDATTRDRHEALGFHAGWSAAFDQLVALMRAH